MRTPLPGRLLGAAVLTAALIASTAALAGCGSSAASDTGAVAESTVRSSADMAADLTVGDPWVKAADHGMTAAFGTLGNTGRSDVVVTSAASAVSSGMELHETVKGDDGGMAMRPKPGGFTVKPGGTHQLAPGGDHIMVMKLTRPLRPGERIAITLTMKDGSTKRFEATVKPFTGADEKYQGGK